ncbi:MAG: response regulator [Ferrovum sp.]|nr:response regulator [Ferrovum sp.]
MTEKIRYFLEQVRAREGEHEQVLLRVTFSLMVFSYLILEELFDQLHSIPPNVIQFLGWWIALSFLLLLVVLYDGLTSRRRQWLAMFLDISAVTYLMLNLHEAGYLLYGIYLWVIVGNGIRYGILPLIGAYTFSLLGFAIVISLNSFWSSQPRLSIGLFLTLTLIPLYLIKLLNQLNKAIQFAQEANQAKSRFLAHMSHEMRTPLNGVIGTSDLLTTTPLNGEQFDLVNTLKTSAQTLLQLIENVLDFAKIESGKLISEKANFDLHQMVRGTLEMFRPQARLKGLRLDVRFSSDTTFLLRGDTLHLRQIIINLVGNAIKFTNKGSVELRVSTQHQDEQSTRIRFEVIDTGIGIASDAQKSIFDSFTQANNDISRQYGGSGLGTTISRQLTHLMGGEIGLHSESGVGSVFWFELPFEKQHKAEGTSIARTLVQLHVITIGMSVSERDSLSGYLKGWGIKFNHEIGMTSFFTILEQIPPNQHKSTIVLCSPQNLGMNPDEFARRVLAICPSRELSLIWMTSNIVSDVSEHELLEIGYTCLLRIPVDKTLLFNALHGAMTPQPQQGVISFKEHYKRSALEKSSASILLAEDNGTNRKIISKILEYGGHRVDLAENGEEALDKLEDNRYGLIILDMNMPLMGGLDVLKIHRATSRQNPPTPVIILTANATTEAKRACEEAGANLYMSKPVDSAALLEAINQLTSVLPHSNSTETDEAVDRHEASELPPLIRESTLRHLEMLGEGQEDFMPIVIHGFISETEKLLEAMRHALAHNDLDAFLELAHTIKGSAGNIGAEALHIICSDVMQLGTHLLQEQASSYLTEALQCFKNTQLLLTQHLSREVDSSLLPSSTQ